MKEINPKPKESRARKTTTAKPPKYADQNHPPPSKNAKPSRWGSNIVKGFSGEKKNKTQTTELLPTRNNNSNISNNNKVKRGLIGELSCSVAASQVHPQSNHKQVLGSGSRDLFVEIENLRALLKESKEREFQLNKELSESKRNNRVLELEKGVKELVERVSLVESEKTALKKELLYLNSGSGRLQTDAVANTRQKPTTTLEMEVVELRRLNKELQLQKRDLACRTASVEMQLANSHKATEKEIIGKIKAEASMLRHTNEDLSKQVEGLQMNRLNEVEELAYLRWVNAQLRNELCNSCSCAASETGPSPRSTEINPIAGFLDCSSAKRLSVVKKLNKWPVTDNDLSSLEGSNSSPRRHSISGSQCSDEDPLFNKRRQSDGFMCSKQIQACKEENQVNCQKLETSKALASSDVEKKVLRVPNPPPRPSCANSAGPKEAGSGKSQTAAAAPPPPPPPPPPPRFSAEKTTGIVRRAPQVVEFYHSLMRRDTRRDSTGAAACDNTPNVASVRSNMIGEIENRSSYLLAVRADVETQGEFVNLLIREVNNAIYRDIEDVVAFVKWLDDELCFLVDERAVLKHFDWPEKKADTLREAAFSYKDLKKLESEVTSYQDDPRLPCDVSLKKMVSLSEKIERSIYNLLKTRDSLMHSCREFQIPTDWMLDSEIISKVKLGSVKLAKKYMNRVATELRSRSSLDKDPAMDYMLLQGVRFAFRIHQFVGGFDAETMQAFEELRKLAHALNRR